jgi:hypothetical protein
MKSKKLLKTSIALILLCISSQTLNAQFLVYDPMQFSNMVQSIAQQTKQAITTAKTLTETKNILKQAIRTKEEIENLHKLTREAHDALKVAKGIVDLKWADLNIFTEKAADISIDPHVYLPDGPLRQRLGETLQGAPTANNAKQLYTLLSGLTSFYNPVRHYTDFIGQMNESLLNQFSVEEMAGQKRLQAALSYNQLADEMIGQAHEMMTAVKTDFKLTMNDAERLTTLKQCSELLVKSVELKVMSDELIGETMKKGNSAKHSLQQAYKNALFRKSLAETPQARYEE